MPPKKLRDKINVEKIKITTNDGEIGALVLSPKNKCPDAPGILWCHGGGYIVGMKEIVYFSSAIPLILEFGAVVVSPGYRMALKNPYPAPFDDCYASLLYMKDHSHELGINPNQIMVGGESAGGGLCVAVCMKARDTCDVAVAYQMPLYPMLDNRDTESSKDNHGKVWNTKKNHFAWKRYLRNCKDDDVSPYAAPALQTDYTNLPPCYTFVADGEPFYCETLTFIDNLKKAGVEASCDVYPGDTHSFDIARPNSETTKQAVNVFKEKFAYAKEHYFAHN